MDEHEVKIGSVTFEVCSVFQGEKSVSDLILERLSQTESPFDEGRADGL